jgi:hypothetical protein
MGGPGLMGWWLDPKHGTIFKKSSGVFISNLVKVSVFRDGLLNDLVVDIGDVLNVANFISQILKVATYNIEDDEGTRIANVKVILNRWSAGIELKLAFLQRDEILFTSGFGIIELHAFSVYL